MKATIRIQTDRVVARASELLRGHFVEYDHRCINGGIYEEGSPQSDERGFRKDVLGYFKELKPTLLRYPGGNYACDFDFRDAIGPKDQRPMRFNYGTQRIQSLRFGLHEFMDYCKEAGCQPLLTFNAGSGTPEHAADFVQYCNAEKGYYADLRRKNGAEKPWGVKHWCIGNEIYGDWVNGTKTGPEYGRWAAETGKLAKFVDPSIKLFGMATGQYSPDWDRASIDASIDVIDYVSLHIYIGRRNYYDCVGSPIVIEQGINMVRGVIEGAATKKNLTKLPPVSLDEYNVWYRTKHVPDGVEEIFNLQDALTMAGIQHVLFRNAEKVGVACLSMTANVLGPIRTRKDAAFRQTIYWPLKFVADYFGPEVVDNFVKCPTFTCNHPKMFAGIVEVDQSGQEVESADQKILARTFEGLPYLDVCTTVDRPNRRLTISAVNRHETQAIEADVQVVGDKISGRAIGKVLTAATVKTENSFESPDAVTPAQVEGFAASNAFAYTFPPHSQTVLLLAL